MSAIAATTTAPRYFDPAPPREETILADICIYGATSGGVIAAIEAAERGRRVVLLEPSAHLGGMSSGGLGFTDIGSKNHIGAIGGKAREFYQRVGRHYGADEEWYFEPHVAERIFETWLATTDVHLYRRQFIDTALIEKNSNPNTTGHRITAIRTLSGLTVRASIFIDCSYEGDLLACAQVTSTIGRESSTRYDETFNGMHVRDNHFMYPIDPYNVPGLPSSGLLPGIEHGDDFVQHAGDTRIQAYNFRVCMTRRPDLRVPFVKPAAYDPTEYILLKRYLNAGWSDVFAKFDSIRNGKTDTNNHGAISTDFIGRNHAYPTADYVTRERIYQQHVAWQQGQLWCLANDPEVPAAIRETMSQWGLARDEFVSTGNWPHALYVRESRRMISDHVMTQHHCLGHETISDSAGLAAHGMDSHTCRRIVQNGVVANEGDVQVHNIQPYPISYRSLVPRRAECQNLYVTFCLSASHIAFGSIRMEPVLMVLGQTAAIAADIALTEHIAVQDVTPAVLQPELLAAGQILAWPPTVSNLCLDVVRAKAPNYGLV